MERIIVHLGAHRTGTTLFQEYLHGVAEKAAENGFDLIGINKTRDGMLEGLLRGSDDGLKGQEKLSDLNAQNLFTRFMETKSEKRWLVLSEENMIGTMEENLLKHSMYPSIASRLRRFRLPFQAVDRFYISIRNPSDWWASCIFFLVARGISLPNQEEIELIAKNKRGWKEVILDIRKEYPDIPITVRDFSFKLDKPKRQLIMVSGWKYFDVTKNLAKKSNGRKSTEFLVNALLSKGEKEAAERLLKGGIIFPFNFRQRELLEEKYNNDIKWIANNLRAQDRYLIDGRLLLSEKMKSGDPDSSVNTESVNEAKAG